MTGTASAPSICIVAHMAYGAMANCEGHIGGVEWQTSTTARWLAQRGWRVSLVTWREGPSGDETIDGVRVIKACAVTDGWPGFRFVVPRWTSLIAALRRANADIYYHNNAEHTTGQVALWCRRNGRRFVYSVANNPECDPRLPTLRSLRQRVLYRYGIRRADRLIVQTRTQQRMFREGFNLKSVVLPMPCPTIGDATAPRAITPSKPQRVVWVARIARVKRLEWLLDLAEALPEIQFEVAGRPNPENEYTRELFARASTLPNVRLLGAVSRDRISAVYRGALCLCCTSIHEGFPNTFLEAWSHGLPVVSTFDPDDLIRRKGLGSAALDQDGLVAGIRALADARAWSDTSNRAREYFSNHHSIDVAMTRFERVFYELLGKETVPIPVGSTVAGSNAS